MVIITISTVTLLLRSTPFVAVTTLRGNMFLQYLGRVMPVGVMFLLVGYSLLGVDFLHFPYGTPEILIMGTAALLYWKTHNSLLSIGIGLVSYIAMASFAL